MPSQYEAKQRHATFYLDILRFANERYEQGGESISTALAEFDLNWGQIEYGQMWTVAHAEEDTTAAILCSDYALAGSSLLELRLNARELLPSLEKAIVVARKLGRHDAEARHLNAFGAACFKLGQFEQAIEYHQKGLTVSREIDDKKTEAAALGNLGSDYARTGQNEQAMIQFQQALMIARETGYKLGEIHNLAGLGTISFHLGKYEQAIDYFKQGLTIARENENRRAEGHILGSLGTIHIDMGEFEQAIGYHLQSI
jgi:tetratricopeptide (TPR) repeat protein